MWIDLQPAGLVHDHLRDHGHHFLEHFPPFLDEQLVRPARFFRIGTVQKAEVVANVVRENRLELGAEDIPMLSGRERGIFDQDGGGDIAKNEMAVTIAPVQMAAGDFRADHEHALRISSANIVRSGLDAESGRGAGDIHVETKAVDAQLLLDFDRHGRIRPLHIRCSTQDRIHILGLAPGPLQRLSRCLYADLREDRQLFVRALGPSRRHDVRIQHGLLRHHVPRLYAAGLLDEFNRTFGQGSNFPSLDCVRIPFVVAPDIFVEARDQLFIRNAVFGRKQSGRRNHRAAGHFGHVCHNACLTPAVAGSKINP